MDAPTIFVSAEENLGDPIDIRVDIIHPEPIAVVAFPAAAVNASLRGKLRPWRLSRRLLVDKRKGLIRRWSDSWLQFRSHSDRTERTSGSLRFGKPGKLNHKYVRPFQVLAKVRAIAYKLKLPQEWIRVHNTFHVSNLKKFYADEPLAVSLDGLHIDDKLHFVEEPVEIMDHEVKLLKQSRILIIKKSGIQCYNCKEYGHVARECQKPKRAKDAAYHQEKMLLCKKEEAGIQLNAEQADWKDDTDDESDDHELEAHYMYMAKLQQVSPDVVDSGPIFDTEPEQKLIEIVLFIVDSGCSKYMTGNLKLLINFVEKFLGTVKFGNDQIAPVLGYGDLVQGAVTIKRVYYVEGLNHNLFSIGQFCDADLEVAFRKSTCFIRDLKGNDLLTGTRGTDLYSITLQSTNSPNPICLMAKATSSQAWLWHRRLSHLNFETINLLSKNDIVVGLPKLKFIKDHLCSSCELGKAKRKSFHSK
nr:retrovirus-related Pol polyprotein from transposon TNT 1-94 [Tanacetum cinerariifolium]